MLELREALLPPSLPPRRRYLMWNPGARWRAAARSGVFPVGLAWLALALSLYLTIAGARSILRAEEAAPPDSAPVEQVRGATLDDPVPRQTRRSRKGICRSYIM
jgi:hypothetical protein